MTKIVKLTLFGFATVKQLHELNDKIDEIYYGGTPDYFDKNCDYCLGSWGNYIMKTNQTMEITFPFADIPAEKVAEYCDNLDWVKCELSDKN